MVPDPVLRAAAVSLLGTIAEPAIAWLATGGHFKRIELGDPGSGAVARSLADPDGTQRIVVDERLRFEDPGLLSAVLAHEALHSDGEVSDLEELIALSFQALVHMQQLVADPALGSERTLLAQHLNPWVLARLNTREPGSTDLRLVLPDSSPTIFPGGIDRPYFAALFDPAAQPTPGNALLSDLAKAVVEPDAPLPDPARLLGGDGRASRRRTNGAQPRRARSGCRSARPRAGRGRRVAAWFTRDATRRGTATRAAGRDCTATRRTGS